MAAELHVLTVIGSSVIHAVVLAGGKSRRFGADKLNAQLDALTVLDRAVSTVPPRWHVLVIGPPRTLTRSVTFVTEDPPGSGPGAALVAGARVVLARTDTDLRSDTVMVTLPGDAPAGGTAAALLVEALMAQDRTAVIGVDPEGQLQPLQVAVRGTALAALAAFDPTAVVGASARRLVMALDPSPVFLSGQLSRDIDTPEDLSAWRRGG